MFKFDKDFVKNFIKNLFTKKFIDLVFSYILALLAYLYFTVLGQLHHEMIVIWTLFNNVVFIVVVAYLIRRTMK